MVRSMATKNQTTQKISFLLLSISSIIPKRGTTYHSVQHGYHVRVQRSILIVVRRLPRDNRPKVCFLSSQWLNTFVRLKALYGFVSLSLVTGPRVAHLHSVSACLLMKAVVRSCRCTSVSFGVSPCRKIYLRKFYRCLPEMLI